MIRPRGPAASSSIENSNTRLPRTDRRRAQVRTTAASQNRTTTTTQTAKPATTTANRSIAASLV